MVLGALIPDTYTNQHKIWHGEGHQFNTEKTDNTDHPELMWQYQQDVQNIGRLCFAHPAGNDSRIL